jgi:hypothetical protein
MAHSQGHRVGGSKPVRKSCPITLDSPQLHTWLLLASGKGGNNSEVSIFDEGIVGQEKED